MYSLDISAFCHWFRKAIAFVIKFASDSNIVWLVDGTGLFASSKLTNHLIAHLVKSDAGAANN